MVKTERSTSQESVTQDSDYLMSTLSRRTATTTRFSPEAARNLRRQGFWQHPIRWAFISQALTRWHHLSTEYTSYWTGLLLIYRPREDERLSWLTCSGRFTRIVVTRRLQAKRRTGSVCRQRPAFRPTVLPDQLCYATVISFTKIGYGDAFWRQVKCLGTCPLIHPN